MFTGLVEEIGTVAAVSGGEAGRTLTVDARRVLDGTRVGDSLAVDGTCLTVTRLDAASFAVDATPETLRRTTLGGLAAGDRVNLERALAADGRVGGHFVQGHVDGTGVIRGFTAEGDSLWVEIAAAPELLRYLVPKGYVAVDGISLTVVEARAGAFTLMLVPHTLRHVTLAGKRPGQKVNLEVDILGKYVEKLLEGVSHAV